MLVEGAKDRAAMGEGDDDNLLLMGLDSPDPKAPADQNKDNAAATGDQPGGLLDLDSMLGGGPSTTEPATNNLGMGSDIMDLFGSGPSQPAGMGTAPVQSNDLLADVLNAGAGMP